MHTKLSPIFCKIYCCLPLWRNARLFVPSPAEGSRKLHAPRKTIHGRIAFNSKILGTPADAAGSLCSPLKGKEERARSHKLAARSGSYSTPTAVLG